MDSSQRTFAGYDYLVSVARMDRTPVEPVKLLLDRGAPLEALNCYGGTVLEQALWSAVNGDPGIDFVPIIETLIAAGAKVDVYPGMKESIEEVLRRKRNV